MAYTNHTLLPEALEQWPVRLFRSLLPRLLEIIYEINSRFLDEVGHRYPGDVERQRRMSLIGEGEEPQVRMAYLAIVGSFSVNGVAELHTKLLKQGLFRDFYELWPQKFNNKTNGVTQRRWMKLCNPDLAKLLTATIGDGWVTDLDRLQKLAPLAEDRDFTAQWDGVKRGNKQRLATLVAEHCGVEFPVDAMFDVQVKRIHEYKRQLLNVLHVIHLYDRIKRGDTKAWVPRCVLIGGKAAPGYYMAKRIIKLINCVADVINADPDTAGRLRLAFLPNYNVSTMEMICAGTDLSEQISTAGKEASGTGNMKFMMNGAVTIGTLDGANIEIREAVGADYFLLFGLTEAEVQAQRQNYDPGAIIAGDPELARVVGMIETGKFHRYNEWSFHDILDAIRSPSDPWMVAADFRSFVDAQRQAERLFQDRPKWLRASILNSAHSGRFSTDRTMRDYNRDIWHLTPVTLKGD
jgi:starch phosphorylase